MLKILVSVQRVNEDFSKIFFLLQFKNKDSNLDGFNLTY